MGLLTLQNSFSQDKIDSLEKALKNSSSDSLRLKTLIKLSKSFQYKDFLKAGDYSAQALEIARKKNWNWGKTMALSQAGYLATINGDHSSAMKYDNEKLNWLFQLEIAPRSQNH
ncbi:MAG: hypothetical protein IPJ20_22140 [Flammeovirgaceae bacterium]|nr:hypothetical protein [Flammeovirgaceae bacterium]